MVHDHVSLLKSIAPYTHRQHCVSDELILTQQLYQSGSNSVAAITTPL